jgi:hypothetical protein
MGTRVLQKVEWLRLATKTPGCVVTIKTDENVENVRIVERRHHHIIWHQNDDRGVERTEEESKTEFYKNL